MKSLLPILPLCLGAQLFAQVQITLDNLPRNGDQIPISICAYIPDASELNSQTGPDYTWDFSNLVEEESRQFDFKSPDATFWQESFPNSNHCGIGWDGFHSYYNFSSDGVYAEGYANASGESDTFKMVLTDLEKFIPIPYSMGSTLNDNFSGWALNNTILVTINGSVNFEADGQGMLILPNGTYSNVVRYRINRTQQATFNGTPANTITKKQWGWFSAEYRFWLLLMESTNDGISDQHLVWYSKIPQVLSPANLKTHVSATDQFTIYPNPVQSGASLKIPGSSGCRVELYDISGMKVYSESSITEMVSIDHVNPGIYLLHILDPSGKNLRIGRVMIIR